MRRAPRGLQPDDAHPRLGVLGGTFNPVTRAHLGLADAAVREFSLGEVLFLLPASLPHRAPKEASLDERLALLEAALASSERYSLAVCSHGLLLEMAEALTPHYPAGVKVYFLLGSDAAERILTWNYPDPAAALAEMFARFDLIVADRAGRPAVPQGVELQAFQSQIHRLALPAGLGELSATGVREAVQAGNPVGELVPPEVAERIRRTGLYRSRG